MEKGIFDMTDATEMLHPRNPPDPETQISRYNFKLNQNLSLILYREIPRNVSFLMRRITGMRRITEMLKMHFQWKLWYTGDTRHIADVTGIGLFCKRAL